GEDIFLDIRHLGEEFINEELPQERKLAKLYESVDPVHDLIPIKPVAHYTMGGIEVDENSKTSIEGLYAAGECANHKVHGANRLGGNSLLELIVFGKQAGEAAAKHAKKSEINLNKDIHVKDINNFIIDVKNYINEVDFYQKREFLGDMFYLHVGIKREKENLESLLKDVTKLLENLPMMGVSDKSKIYNSNLIEFLEFKNMLELSQLVVIGAIARQESRGAHFRVDKPNENDELFKAHSVIDKNGNVSYED
ncbi:MAG: FAD-binding protein, partial [Sulfurimonas sp.]|nr:FAD-binding protein [Sulfurimonas sp.]